jgi:hypothetical protein
VNTDALYHYTEMVLVLAQTLGWDRDRDEPSLQDIIDASHMVWRWNINRIALGLRPWI